MGGPHAIRWMDLQDEEVPAVSLHLCLPQIGRPAKATAATMQEKRCVPIQMRSL